MPGQAHQLWKYQLVENFDVYLHKKSTSCLTFFLRYCNILQICHFGYFGYKWPCPSKLIISTCLKVWCLSSKKSTSFILSWVRFVHFWAAFPQNSIPTSFLKNLIKYQIKKEQKSRFEATPVSDGSTDGQALLQRYCKLATLGTLGMTCSGHQERWYQLAENFDVYLHVKKIKLPNTFLKFY